MKVGDRDEAIKGLGNGKIQILTSVDVISEGTDVPDVSAAILLRPTKSEGLYLQQVGRVLRPKPGKTAIILDHVNSTRTHGFVDDKKDWSLHSKKKKKKKGAVVPHVETCKKCFATYKPTPVCPVCGYEAQNRERFIKQEEGELEELKRKETEDKQKQTLIRSARTLEELEQVAQILGYKKGWAYITYQTRNNKQGLKKSNLSIRQKEAVAKILALNDIAYDLYIYYHKQLFSNQKVSEELFDQIWRLTQIDGKTDWPNKKLFRSIFFEMCKHSWDRAYIVNYITAVRNQKRTINTNFINDNHPSDPTGFIT